MDTNELYTIAKMGIAVGVVDLTVTRATIFEKLRDWVDAHSNFFGELVSCPYCFAHWASFFVVAVYRPRLFVFWWPLDFFLTALVVAWLGVMCASLAFTATNKIRQ